MHLSQTGNSLTSVTSAPLTQEAGVDRLRIDNLLQPDEQVQADQDAVADLVGGLRQSPKFIPPRYFYDDYGSQLFEQICTLPEYYLTRTETAILQAHAGAIAQLTGACELVELGSGSATKTRLLLDAYQTQGFPLLYRPIDVSAGILESSAQQLLIDYPTLKVHGLVSTYQLALQRLPATALPSRMIGFIGSTLGNLAPDACDRFFQQVKTALSFGEYFLLGIDLQKPKSILEAAYNDSQGVTAAFNLNMLRHLNRKFDGDFDLAQFEHQAFYNDELHQIELHLRSRVSQTVHLRSLNMVIELQAGETILSEISRKFNLDELGRSLQTYGLQPVRTWTDPQKWFGVVLSQAR